MKALLDREMKEFYIREPLTVVLMFSVFIFMFWPSIAGFSDINIALIKTLILYVIPIAVFMLYSSVMMSRQFYKEIIEGKIEMFLGIGYSGLQVWMAKTITMCLTLYFLLITALLSGNIISLIMNQGTILFYLSNMQILMLTVFGPLTGLSIIAFVNFLELFTRDSVIVKYVPIVLFGVFAIVSNKLQDVVNMSRLNLNFNLIIIVLSTVITISFLGIPVLVLKAAKKEQFIK